MIREHREFFIGGEWVAPATSNTIDVISPSNEELVGRTPEGSRADIDRAVAAARLAFDHGPWPRTPSAERGKHLAGLAGILRGRSQEIADVITDEVGTPASMSLLVQAAAGVMALDYYAKLAGRHEFEDLRSGMTGKLLVVQEPVGVVAAIVPWNYPFYLTMCKVSAALAAGCTVVLKPSPETPLDAYIVAEAVAEAGLPPGVVNVVPADREVSEHLVRHPGVDKVSFTGSTEAGRRIMAACADSVRRVTLELGGKSACILLDDASLDMAVPMAVQAATINSGQTCVCQTRLLVPRSLHDEVVDRMTDAFANIRVGDPHDSATQLGPLVSGRQRERVEGYIGIGEDEGAKIAHGGGRPADLDRGFFVEPTIFVGVENSMRIAQEEIFGPVLSVIAYDGDDEAVSIANDSIYGLSGAVWTGDDERGLRVARRIRTGTFAVNGLAMDVAAPFGGFKQSGIGRELGPEGLLPYLEYKSITMPAGYQPASATD